MVYVTRRATFSASHRLFNPDCSDEENRQMFGKCANPNGHGHNYTLEVTVAGKPGSKTGYVLDLKVLKEIIAKEVLDKVDHKHLNIEVDFLRGIIPTAENIAVAIWNALASQIPSGSLHSVRLQETENNTVEYRGESE